MALTAIAICILNFSLGKWEVECGVQNPGLLAFGPKLQVKFKHCRSYDLTGTMRINDFKFCESALETISQCK